MFIRNIFCSANYLASFFWVMLEIRVRKDLYIKYPLFMPDFKPNRTLENSSLSNNYMWAERHIEDNRYILCERAKMCISHVKVLNYLFISLFIFLSLILATICLFLLFTYIFFLSLVFIFSTVWCILVAERDTSTLKQTPEHLSKVLRSRSGRLQHIQSYWLLADAASGWILFLCMELNLHEVCKINKRAQFPASVD
jgi:hypothetical protein